MRNGGIIMKISKKNLMSFVRNHAYGEDLSNGARRVETINSCNVEFMLGMCIGEMRILYQDKYTVIPIQFISDERLAIIESVEEFDKFISIFFRVKECNSEDLNISFKMIDYFENQIIVEECLINPSECKTLIKMRNGMITEDFILYK